MPVQFFFVEVSVALTERTRLKEFIQGIFKQEERRLGKLNYIFCSDDHLLNINRQFLEHDYYTDIITFDISEAASIIDGEIYISVDRVRDNARILSQSVKKELHRVVFHGALHLCGYKDDTKIQKEVMRSKEEFYLRKFFK